MKLIAFVFVLLASSTAIAQPRGGGNTFGGDLAIVLPLDDYGDFADFGIGPLLRIEVPAGPGYFTGRTGFLWHATDAEDFTFLIFPIYAGYRYPVGGSGGYLAGELGLSILYADSDFGSDSETELGMTLGGGLRKGAFDIRGALFLPDVGDALGLMFSVGYDFSTF